MTHEVRISRVRCVCVCVWRESASLRRLDMLNKVSGKREACNHRAQWVSLPLTMERVRERERERTYTGLKGGSELY